MEATWTSPESKIRSRVSLGFKDRAALLGISAIIAEQNTVSGKTVRMSSPGDVLSSVVYRSRVPLIGDKIGLLPIMHNVSPFATVVPERIRYCMDELPLQKCKYGCGDIKSFVSRGILPSDFILDRMPIRTASTAMTVTVPYRR